MSNSLDHVHLGLVRAFERRAKESARQKTTHVVQRFDSDAVSISASSNTTKLSNEEYKATLVHKMNALIHKRNMK
ncbi:hypothetical protein C4J93_3476 [Pseudomonas sp. R2-37-08W]|nr:hypothetical protein C4J93_3476 [Pseudomonas sp. R2-37-08W]